MRANARVTLFVLDSSPTYIPAFPNTQAIKVIFAMVDSISFQHGLYIPSESPCFPLSTKVDSGKRGVQWNGQQPAQLPIAETVPVNTTTLQIDSPYTYEYQGSNRHMPTVYLTSRDHDSIVWMSPSPRPSPRTYPAGSPVYTAFLKTAQPLTLLSQLPPKFPPYADSILAELWPSTLSNFIPQEKIPAAGPLKMLQELISSSSAIHHNQDKIPSMFAYAHVSYRANSTSELEGKIPPSFWSTGDGVRTIIRFGVSSARAKHKPRGIGRAVRAHRTYMAWGGMFSSGAQPRQVEGWLHGQCAELQAIPAVVEWCERLGLEDVVIYSLAMRRSGQEVVAMCRNCSAYRSTILSKHPSWRVVDAATGKSFSHDEDSCT
ncbi:hypothetical protein DFP72DRAFT_1064712 [Ephemerocybe angulata]|uniref:Uncharacterized protein n=1 Tax=Ephemerocybe angulata TaxID=980116 RepID=A0A8H6MC14_9AGAR|nr:hypothetical protein DFP72DRAFT_1064712 [Tulosesus angulatus]